ncbi:MAG: hypothetical protein U0414_25990 [Polyangiaceae bacterium]
MFRSHWLISVLTVGLLGVGAVGAVGCDDGNGGTGGGDTSGGGGFHPPGRPSGSKPGDGTGKTIALTKIVLGTANSTAWQDLGYDLDNKVTTTTNLTDHCTPNSGGSAKDVFPDGKEGRDNAFGKKILPLVKSIAGSTNLEDSVAKAISDGSFTVMINLPTLGADKNYDPLKAFLLGGKNGTPMGAPTTWEIVPELLNGTTADSAKVHFDTSYLTDNTWVSGEKGTVSLSLSVAGFTIALDINAALLSMKLDDTHTKATSGVIAGVLNTEALISQIQKLASTFSKDFCDPKNATLLSILNQIRQNSDIMADGSNGPGKTCDGISIGLGFEAQAVTLGPVGMKADPPEDKCAMTTSSSASTGTGM